MRAQSSGRADCSRLIAPLDAAAGVRAIEIVVAPLSAAPTFLARAIESLSFFSRCAKPAGGGAAAVAGIGIGIGRRDADSRSTSLSASLGVLLRCRRGS